MLKNKYKTSQQSHKKKVLKKRAKERIVCSELKTLRLTNEPSEEYQPSTGLFEEDDVEGKRVYQVTPLRPKKVTKEKASSLTDLPTREECPANKRAEAIKEPQGYNLRQKIKQELASMKSKNMDSDPEDSDEYLSDDTEKSVSSSDSEYASTSNLKKGQKNVANSFAETYFFAQKDSKSSTSNRTLSNVKLEQITVEDLSNLLQNIPECHKNEKSTLFKHYYSYFEKWSLLLQEGFNILLYGVGSKHNILDAFCKKSLGDKLHIVLHGYFPSLNIKQMLSAITEEALECEDKFTNMYDHIDFIKKFLVESEENLYIVIHNIDGVPLRGVKTQSILSSLAAIPKIHFLASVDHINSPLIWDQIMLSHFNWVWYDTTTFEPYIYETSYDKSLLRDQSSHLLLSSLLHVFHSLTSNGRGVFLILAKFQNESKGSSFSGMAFHEWYQECREAFLVNSEITMQAQLSEFKNHKLLASRKSVDGSELWYIPVDADTLQQFLESCE